jgi:hypothetical protein
VAEVDCGVAVFVEKLNVAGEFVRRDKSEVWDLMIMHEIKVRRHWELLSRTGSALHELSICIRWRLMLSYVRYCCITFWKG